MAPVATQRQPSDLTNDAISQVFIAHRPREKKINKTLKKFNKRVSKVGTHISRTTGIVDVGDSDSGESNKNDEDIGDDFYDEDGMLKYDSELKIVHDSLVPIPQQPKIRNPYSEYADYDYDYEQRMDENSRMLRAQRHELEYQKRTARLQQEWASGRAGGASNSGLRSAMKKSQPISFDEPKAVRKEASTESFNFVGQAERHQLYRKQRSRATAYAAASDEDDDDHHDEHRISNPSRQETYYSYYEDEMRAKRRKKAAEEREKSKKGVWNTYIDTDEDQDPLTDAEELSAEGAAGARGIASNGGSSESVARLPTPDFHTNNQELELSHPSYTSSSPGAGGAKLKSKSKVEKKEKMNYTGRALNAVNNAIFDQSAPVSRFSAKSLFGKKQKRVVAPLPASPPPDLNGLESTGEDQVDKEVNHEEKEEEEEHHSRPPSPAKSVKSSTSSVHSVAGSARPASHHSNATVVPGHLPTPPPGSPVASMHSRKSSPTPSGSVVGSHVSGSHHSGVSAAASAVSRGSVAGGSHASSAAHSRRSHKSHATHRSSQSHNSHVSERSHRSSQSRHSTVVPEAVAPEVVAAAPAAKTTGAQLYDYWLNARGYVGGMIWGKKEVVTTTTQEVITTEAASPLEEMALGSRPPSVAGSAASSKRSVSASPHGSFVGSVASGRSKHSSPSHHSSHHSVAHSHHSASPSHHSVAASVRSPAPSIHSSHHSIAPSHRSHHSEAAHSVVPGSFVSGAPGSFAQQSHHGSAAVGSFASGGGGGGSGAASVAGEAIVLEEALDEHSTFSHHPSGSPAGSIMARETTDNEEFYNSDDEYGAKEERRRKFKSAMKYVFQRKSSTGGSVHSQDPLSLPAHPPASSLYEGSIPGGSIRSGHSRHTIAPTILDDASVRSGKESMRSRRSGRSGMSMRSMSDQHGTRPPSMRSIRSSNTVVPHSRAATIVDAEGVSQEVAVAGGGSKFGALGEKWNQFAGPMQPVVSNFVDMFRSTARLSFILRPVDAVADAVPSLQNAVVVVELVLLMWILYQVSIVVETMATFVKTLCMPVIMVSRALGLKM